MELSQVLQALRNADAAGDTEAAKRLAQIARQLTGGAPAPSTDRTFGEAATDVGAALLRGTGQALQFPGQLVGLAPGMQGLGEALATPGKALAEYGQGLKSAGLRAREALRNQALSDAEKEGFLAEFATAIGQTIKDPALLSTFLLEQVPQLIGPAAAAKVTTMLGREGLQAVAAGGAREAAEKALRERAAAAAVGTGAAAQGASVGDETYKAVYDLAIKQGMSEEDARALALEKARIAAIEAGVISVATSRLPGGAAIERRLAGLPGVPGAGRIGVGAREALTEGLEEAGGAGAKGVAMAEVDPSISPLTGVGTAAGFGVLGGAGLGTFVGGSPTAEQRAPKPEAPAEIDRLKREAAEKAQAEERARTEPVNRAQAVIDETEGLPIGEAFPRLTREIEALRQQPKSPERDEAIKALTEERRRRQTEDAGQLIEGRRAAQGFMTAEEAEAAGVVPRGEFDAVQAEIEDLTRRRNALLVKGKPPAPKSPARKQFNELDARIRELSGTLPTAPTAPTGAEAVPEPTVRVEQGPKPLPEVLDSETVKTIGFVRGRIHDALVGKSITDPEIRAVLEDYKQRKNASTKTVAKIDAFLGRLPEPVAPPAVEAAPEVPTTPAVEAVTPTETPSDTGTEPATGGAGVPVATEPDTVGAPGGAGVVEPTGVVPPAEDVGQPPAGEGEQPGAVTPPAAPNYAEYTPKQLEQLLSEAPKINLDLDVQAIRKYVGEDAATAYVAMSPRKREMWWEKNATEAMEREGSAFNGVDEDRVGEFLDAQSAFATDSPQELGRSIALIAKDINNPNFRASPSFVTLRNALQYANSKGWSEKEVLDAMRGRAQEWAGNDAKELFKDLFKPKAKKEAVPAPAPKPPAIAAPAPKPPAPAPAPKPPAPAPAPKPPAPAPAAPLFTKRRVRNDDNRVVTEVTLQDGSKYQIVKLSSSEAMGLPGWYDTRVVDNDYLGSTEQEAIDTLLKRAGIKPSISTVPPAPKPPAPAPVSEETPKPTGLKTTQSRFKPTNLENSKEMDDALRGKSFMEAVDFAILNARDDIDRAIMVKVKRRAEELEFEGFKFSFEMAPRGKVLRGVYGRAILSYSPLGQATEVKVQINGYTGRESDSLNQETLVHELIHAVTAAQVRFAPQGTAAIKLRALRDELAPILKDQSGPQYNPVVRQKLTIAVGDPNELLAYGLTDVDVKLWLGSVVDKSGKTFLSRLFDIVSQVFNLKGKENTALARLMSISEELLNESLDPYIAEANKNYLSFGKQTNTTGFPNWTLAGGRMPVWVDGDLVVYQAESVSGKTIYIGGKRGLGTTRTDISAYTGQDFTPTELKKLRDAADRFRTQVSNAAIVGEPEKTTLGDYFARTFGARKTIGLRALMMDSLASVEAKLGEAYGEKIRDMMGNMNPVVLLSRALDSVRFAAEMLNVGKMVVDPSGMTRLTTLSHNGQNISYASVMRDIKAEAERRGMTGEAFVKEIGEVLAGRREYELMRTPDAASLEFFLTPQEAQAANNRFNNDAFIKDVSEKLDAIRFAGIDFLVATGRIPESKAQEWKDATGYIPFKRIDEMDKLYAERGGGVPSDLKLAAFKGMGKFTGSDERQTENPLENFVSLMEWMTREGMKAEAVGRALNDMVLIGAARRLPNPQVVAANQKGAVVPSWENGQQKFYIVPDPADLAAFAGFKAGSVAGPIKAMQQVSKVLRIGVTATPAFAIKQVFDDITRAYVHSGVKNPAALIPRMMLEMPKAWWAEVRGLRTPGMEMLARHGVVPTYDTIEGGNVRNIFEETGISKRSMSKAIMRIIEAGAKASDIATRQAIFDQTMKETGDVDLAEQRAREIINFSRKGASSTADFFIRTVPFFNAYARSMDKLLLAAAGNPAMQKTLGMSTGYARNLFFKRMTVLTAAGLAYAMLMSDDEDYQDLSDNVRDRNWVLPYGKELGFTPVIPLPAELAFFFKAIPERVVQYYKLQGTPEERDALRVAKEMLLAGVDLFWTPNLTPQLVKPFLENLVNYSFFLGRPLESQAQLALDPSKRYGTSTSEAIKAGTEALSNVGVEISPIMVENAVRGVLGMSAGLVISVADALVNPSRTDRPLHQQIIPQLTGASALMKDPVGNRFLDDIYDLDKKVEQAYNTYKKEEKDDPEKANEYYLKTFGLQSIREEMKDVMKAVRDMNAQSRAIDKMTDIPSEERAQLIADLKSQQNELARISYALRRRAALAQMEVDRQ